MFGSDGVCPADQTILRALVVTIAIFPPVDCVRFKSGLGSDPTAWTSLSGGELTSRLPCLPAKYSAWSRVVAWPSPWSEAGK